MNGFREKLNNFVSWNKRTRAYLYVVATFVLLYIWLVYGKFLHFSFDMVILPKLAHIQSNIGLVLFTIAICLIAIIDIVVKIFHRYRMSPLFVYCLSWILAIFLYYQSTGEYQYLQLCPHLSYFTIFIVIGCAYVGLAIFNGFLMVYNMHDEQPNISSDLVKDWPIDDPKEDVLSVAEEARSIAEQMMLLSSKKTWSIAITAAWGVGKTSFLNLVRKYLPQKECDIMVFNPRDSKSFECIQTDFFSSLANTMSKYDAKCSNKFRQYMSALQLIDDRGIIKKILNVYNILDKESLKCKLTDVFAHTNKRIVVFIDDFDRLSKLEILEVLKLIDSNADFTNLIFITAFDKSQVNQSMGDENNTKDASFVDKFFNVEYPIPIRPYKYIRKYIADVLVRNLNNTDEGVENIEKIAQENEYLLYKYVPTIRDAKRFLNQFFLDYKFVQKEVDYTDFFLLHLVKYRYYEEYINIFNKVYLDGFNLYGNVDLLYLGEKASSAKIYDVLQKMFPVPKESRTDTYKHICEKNSFGNYFLNRVYSTIKLEDLNMLLKEQSQESLFAKIDGWLAIGGAAEEDLLKYLMHFDNEKLPNTQQFTLYTNAVVYFAVKAPDTFAFWLVMRLLYIDHLEKFVNIYHIKRDEYVNGIFSIILNESYCSQLKLAQTIHRNIICKHLEADKFDVDDSFLKTKIEEQFISSITNANLKEEECYTSLLGCIDYMEENTKKIKLIDSCCKAYRSYINNYPTYFIRNFVHLTMPPQLQPDYNSVVCEVFWQQIFINKEDARDFIENCMSQDLPGADAANAFFPIYVANDNNPVDFYGDGNVEKKLQSAFVMEKNQFENLQSLGSKISIISSSFNENNLDDIRKECEEIRNQLEENKLNIKLKDDLKKQLSTLLDKLEYVK